MSLKAKLEQKKRERIRKERLNTAKKFAVGTVAGVVGGLMLAPKSGKETREDIKVKAKEVNENLKVKTSEVKENALEAKEKISKYIAEKKICRKPCCEEVEEACECDSEIEEEVEENLEEKVEE
ncbi:MAG: YtxH domain-containing protein [Clostridium argentinense]|uniref:YtxH domain-containing protein n=1 Tax=Clostridium faecium TaxID=2762223 RepID=A0ABR8YNX5_9CLOT|nr:MULTISPECIES: YtxH domain-containing protein [Clostridium]MBD8045918.1 YtxH domain-containing protein [Clostridium faecium]MBS5822557.1 YtxH domain-containing protein [Clostridium argentinense]MDU1347996.1 YtxH domain-containing protein [Clostridium argentinense]